MYTYQYCIYIPKIVAIVITKPFSFIPQVPTSIRNSKGKDEVTDQHHQYKIYPYWAWSPCFDCKSWRPPRCYHCPICRTCVLKRDHHCFFVRNCVGFQNQKYFTMFCTWATFSQFYVLILSLMHYFSAVWNHVTIFDLLPFASFSRYAFGYPFGHTGFHVIMSYGLAGFLYPSTMQWINCMDSLFTSHTPFEREHGITIVDSRGICDRLRAVFGDLWYVQFIVPLFGERFTPTDDPYHWQYLTLPKRRPQIRARTRGID